MVRDSETNIPSTFANSLSRMPVCPFLDLSKSLEYCVYYGGWRLSFGPGCEIVPVQTGRRIG